VLPSRFFLTLSVNILSEILINSEIIPKCHKLFEARRNRYTKCEDCRGHHMVIIQTYFEKKIFIIEMYQNVPEEIRIREKNCVRKAGRIKKASRGRPKMAFWLFLI
jgi:hypothetical protein